MPMAAKDSRTILTVSVLPFTDACHFCSSVFSIVADDMMLVGTHATRRRERSRVSFAVPNVNSRRDPSLNPISYLKVPRPHEPCLECGATQHRKRRGS